RIRRGLRPDAPGRGHLRPRGWHARGPTPPPARHPIMADSLTSAYLGGTIATGLSHGDPPERRARAVLARLLAEPGSHLVVRYHPPTVGDGPDGPAVSRVDRRAPDGALLGT